jgi:hypothetical protein
MSAIPKTRIRPEIGPGSGLTTAATPPTNQAASAGAASSPAASLRCPRCRRALIPVWEGELQCTRPSRPHSYPIVAGIPDLRAVRDSDITVARERADARLLAEALSRASQDGEDLNKDASLLATGGSFAEERQNQGSVSAPRTSEEVLREWQEVDRGFPDPRMVLDVSCGSGELLEATAHRWPV